MNKFRNNKKIAKQHIILSIIVIRRVKATYQNVLRLYIGAIGSFDLITLHHAKQYDNLKIIIEPKRIHIRFKLMTNIDIVTDFRPYCSNGALVWSELNSKK